MEDIRAGTDGEGGIRNRRDQWRGGRNLRANLRQKKFHAPGARGLLATGGHTDGPTNCYQFFKHQMVFVRE